MNIQNPLSHGEGNSTVREYLHKTIAVKNEHIEELIQELKKTQDLHQTLKKKYQAEEIKLQERANSLQQLVNQLKKENENLLKKLKQMENSKT